MAQDEEDGLCLTYARRNIELISTYSVRNGELCP